MIYVKLNKDIVQDWNWFELNDSFANPNPSSKWTGAFSIAMVADAHVTFSHPKPSGTLWG